MEDGVISTGTKAARPSGKAEKKISDLVLKQWLRKAEAGARMADGGGLFIVMNPGGAASWRIKYRYDGKDRIYSVGTYPAIGLNKARDELAWFKGILREGKDPMMVRKITRADAVIKTGNTFEAVANAWLELRKKDWSAIHYSKSRRALERDIYPALGRFPVDEITSAMVLNTIIEIHDRAADSAEKILQNVSRVFEFAKVQDLRTRDNPVPGVKEVLPKKKLKGRMPAILEWAGLGEVLRSMREARTLSPEVKMASRLCAFTVARIGNIVNATWEQFHDLEGENPEWVIPRAEMKAKDRYHDHRIPLCPEIARELAAYKTIRGDYFGKRTKGLLFPSPGRGKYGEVLGRPITRDGLEKAYRVTLGLDGKHTPHGWRSAFSTLARESNLWKDNDDAIEIQLDHIHASEVIRAYDRGERADVRRELMNWWGRELVRAERGAQVLEFKKAKAA